jgi:hypothetical protein
MYHIHSPHLPRITTSRTLADCQSGPRVLIGATGNSPMTILSIYTRDACQRWKYGHSKKVRTKGRCCFRAYAPESLDFSSQVNNLWHADANLDRKTIHLSPLRACSMFGSWNTSVVPSDQHPIKGSSALLAWDCHRYISRRLDPMRQPRTTVVCVKTPPISQF